MVVIVLSLVALTIITLLVVMFNAYLEEKEAERDKSKDLEQFIKKGDMRRWNK